MSDWRKEWFTFDRKDRVAIPFLFLIILGLVITLSVMDQWYVRSFTESTSELNITADTGRIKQRRYKTAPDKKGDRSGGKKKVQNINETAIQYFDFNPNTISKDSFAMLGFSDKEAQAFINFRSSGYTFYEAEDITSSFIITQNDYERLKPYIRLNNGKHKTQKKHNQINKDIQLDINTASPSEWKQLYGIGPTYAERIIKFRNALGGFHTINQIKEVYGIHDTTFQNIKEHLTVSKSSLQKININDADIAQLKAHPYINYHQANAIVKYRMQHGQYETLDGIKNVHLIDEKLQKHY